MTKRFRVQISENAESDLGAIQDYIARDNPAAAQRWYKVIKRHIRSLRHLPERYEFIPEETYESIHRHVIVGNYRLIYRIVEDQVRIIRVVHAARILRITWLDPESSSGRDG